MPSNSARPNIIVIVPHDTGRFISPYGAATVHTPNCERLASEGVKFANHFCTVPLCSPARAALLTGRHSHQNGVHGLVMDVTGGFDLADSPGERHLVSLLGEAGYQSALIGYMHESRHPARLGFESHDWNEDIRETPATLEAWLAARDRDRPFYIQIGSWVTHRDGDGEGWTAEDVKPDDSKGVWMPPYLQESDQVRREMAQMQGAVRRYDEGLGQILDVIDRHHLAENTIVVSTTDHGIDFPRAKGTLYDPGIEAQMLLRYPAGGWGEGRAIEALSSHVDLVPTLLEAAGIDVPGNLAGRSWLPLLEGGDFAEREYVFAEKTFHDIYDPRRAVRSKRYKYIRHFEVCTIQDARYYIVPRWHMFKGNDWVRRMVEELFDLEQDPWEEHNLARDPAYADVKTGMSRALADWMKATDDPIIDGPVQSPFFAAQMADFLDS